MEVKTMTAFVTIDGVDGVGKTTTARLLATSRGFQYYKSPSGPFEDLRKEVEEFVEDLLMDPSGLFFSMITHGGATLSPQKRECKPIQTTWCVILESELVGSSDTFVYLRRGRDSNPRTSFPVNTLAVCCIRPLCHLSRFFCRVSRSGRIPRSMIKITRS